MSRLNALIPLSRVAAFVLIAGFAPFNATLAAGSGGGSDDYQTNTRGLSPAQLSGKAFRAGLKHRDRALKHEARAAKASSEKARDKSMAKAKKEFTKAIKKQGEAVKIFPQNYKAANELGFALRKTGDYRKAIGAYNYALKINPNFHQATEYRAEAFLKLGFLDQTRQSYMVLFRDDRDLAAQLMEKFDQWIADKAENLSDTEQDFVAWVEERKKLSAMAQDLSMNNSRTW